MNAEQRIGAVLSFALMLSAAPAPAATLTGAPFGTAADGKLVTRYTMATSGGVSVSFMSYGGAITDVTVPDRQGRPGHIVLGFPTLRDYETKAAQGELYFGALLGRYANWIARGRFSLDGHAYKLSLSDPPNTIHGGVRGFDKRIWHVEPQATSGGSVGARLTYISPDGEEGYPGTLKVAVTYTLSDDGAFAIRYEAVTDKDTIFNPSSHMNFNLAGAGSPGGILDHVLTVDADRYTPLDQAQIPLGRLAPVDGTPFDFRKPTVIGARIHDKNEQLAIADGYDQNWVLNKHGDPAQPQFAVRAYDPKSGRKLECLTTEPGVEIYTGGFFDGSFAGTGGRYGKYAAFTLETQHFPDSPNHPDFPTTALRPGQVFGSTSIFRFGVQDERM
jgi:aldose 1-epimerase